MEGRTLVVVFPRTGARLRLAGGTDALVVMDLSAGRRVRITATAEETVIEERLEDGTLRLAGGRTAAAHELWPLELEGALLERLASGDVDHVEDFLIRLDILHLLRIREADGLGSFLGGRVRLYPHQLYVAERATAANPVRWLLADEVGLGKTIEAALILNRLVHTGQVERCLVVAPESLTVQWLGELWRKYHHVFTLLDDARLADVARDFGAEFNPFELHRRTVIALETLVARPHLTQLAAQAGIDLLVVDEAQRLRRPPGHPGDAGWQAVAPIAARGRHVLLLSATPLEDDAHGFFRLLQLLRPDEFPEDVSIDARLASGEPLPPCTSSTRRTDIGGLPPRVGHPVDLEPAASRPRLELEAEERQAPADNAVQRRQKLERIRRALASGAALQSLASPFGGDAGRRQRLDAVDANDPRVAWLLSRAPRWRSAGDKTLVFVAHRETLEMLRSALGQRAQLATGTFHEELTAARRDLEVAQFRAAGGPSLLISTECGGEGRNFEFCRRLVLFDLPWSPTVVEQRIGRLDRIGRQLPVDIVYFRPPRGIGLDVVRLFEAIGVFREPLAGLEPQLAHVERALDEIALDPAAALSDEQVHELTETARGGLTRIREGAYQQLHRDPYRPEYAAGILARVPGELDALTQRVVTTTAARLGFHVERTRGHRIFSIELGGEALVDNLPGVPGGASFVGSFDREEAVEDDTIDFFASGHPLVEGVIAFFDDSAIGRVAQLEIEVGGERGAGVLVIYKEGRAVDYQVVDASGQPRPEWASAIRRRTFRARRLPASRVDDPAWKRLIRTVLGRIDRARRPHAVAAIAVQPRA